MRAREAQPPALRGPSPLPVKPRRSVVVARTFTRSGSTPSAAASRCRISSRWFAIRGSSPIRMQSALTSSKPASRTWRVGSREAGAANPLPASAASSAGKSEPMSPSPAAPSTASVSAWAITSPSEWPARPLGKSIATPPRTSRTPCSNACASTPRPIRSSATERSGQLVERADADRRGRWIVQVAPAAPRPHVDRGQIPARESPARRRCRPGRRRRRVSCAASTPALGGDPLEERGGRLLDSPSARDEPTRVDVRRAAALRSSAGVLPTAPTPQPAARSALEARQRVR